MRLDSLATMGVARSWKSFDWDTMNRLHDMDLISNPATKAKSVTFSDEGLLRAKAAFHELFADDEGPA